MTNADAGLTELEANVDSIRCSMKAAGSAGRDIAGRDVAQYQRRAENAVGGCAGQRARRPTSTSKTVRDKMVRPAEAMMGHC
jgi:hypothetical protein